MVCVGLLRVCVVSVDQFRRASATARGLAMKRAEKVASTGKPTDSRGANISSAWRPGKIDVWGRAPSTSSA